MNPLDPFRFDFNSFLNGLLGSKTFEGKTDLLKHDVIYEIPESLDNIVLPCSAPWERVAASAVIESSQRQRRRSVGERRSVAAPEASQRRREPGASQRRSAGGVAASGGAGSVAASQRRRRRSVGGSPGASQRRSVGGAWATKSVAASQRPSLAGPLSPCTAFFSVRIPA